MNARYSVCMSSIVTSPSLLDGIAIVAFVFEGYGLRADAAGYCPAEIKLSEAIGSSRSMWNCDSPPPISIEMQRDWMNKAS